MMRSKKGGMVLQMALILLLTIIFFAPACKTIGDFFGAGQSKQAQDNFQTFSAEFEKFVNGAQDQSIDSEVLILDEGTVVYVFAKPADYFESDLKIAYPEGKCNKQPCVALCKDFEENDVDIEECTEIIAFPLGEDANVKPAMIARREITYQGSEQESVERRVTVKFKKQEGVVSLSYS